jgi:hypothetical protein
LQKLLQTACGIHRVAHCGKRSPSSIADIADDRRTEMNANPHCKGSIEIRRERLVQHHQLSRHMTRREQGLATGVRPVGLETEQRHDAIARELVDTSSGRLYRLAHGPAIAVEEEDDVVGKLLLGGPREFADIRKQNRDLPFAPAHRSGADERRGQARRREAAALPRRARSGAVDRLIERPA